MSTSYVHREGWGFWCPDWLLEAFAHALGSALRSEADQAIQVLGIGMVARSMAGLSGCLDIGLDTLTAEQATLVERAVQEVKLNIQSDPERLDPNYLNGLGLGTRFAESIQSRHWERLCDAVACLLAGQWRVSASDPDAAPGQWLYADHGREVHVR